MQQAASSVRRLGSRRRWNVSNRLFLVMNRIAAGGSTAPSVSATFSASSSSLKSSSGSFHSHMKSWCFSNMLIHIHVVVVWWTESFCWAASTAHPTAWFASLAQSGLTLKKRRTEESKLDSQPWNDRFGSGRGETQSRRCLQPAEVTLKVFHRSSKAAPEKDLSNVIIVNDNEWNNANWNRKKLKQSKIDHSKKKDK